LIPKKEGAIGDTTSSPRSASWSSARRGTQFSERITLFKSLGIAVEDLARPT
jgi:hypothetical protein